MTILQRLSAMGNKEYADFNSALLPGVAREEIIGVRLPALRAFAREIKGSKEAERFINALPHTYIDEYHLHALLINEERDYEKCLEKLHAFLPYVSNWATCDFLRPKCFLKNRKALIDEIKRWISSDKPYTVRFGLEMLMTHYLDGDFKAEYLSLAAGVESDDYYVKMMVAWYFATALAKQPTDATPYIERYRLGEWVHNKAIQKAVESRRISEGQKEYLRALRRKAGVTEVVAALIWENGKFLICRRPPHKARGMLWEFAGGKIEKGETPKEALVRECMEELGVTLSVGDVFISLTHKYPDMTVHLTLFNCVVKSGSLTRLEHSELRYISPREIDDYDFCPADREILIKLKGERA